MNIKELKEKLQKLDSKSIQQEQLIELELAHLPSNKKGKFGMKLQEEREKSTTKILERN
jgi:hypothetical protein